MKIELQSKQYFLDIFVTIFFIFSGSFLFAAPKDTIIIKNLKDVTSAGLYTKVLVDNESSYSQKTITEATGFQKCKDNIPVFYKTDKVVWFKLIVKNETPKDEISFFLQYANVGMLTMYQQKGNQSLEPVYTGGYKKIKSRFSNEGFPELTSSTNIKTEETATYYIKVENPHPIVFSFFVGSSSAINSILVRHYLIIAFYAGILWALLFYNVFLFLGTKDRNYLYYCFYIFMLLLAQATLLGYSNPFFYDISTSIGDYAVPVTSSLTALSAIIFTIHFLRTRFFTPLLHIVFLGLMLLSIAVIISSFLGNNLFAYRLLDFNNAFAGFIAIITSVIIARKKYRPAYLYLLSWLFFALGIIVFSLRNMGVLPANGFTNYVLYIGTALEMIFLSIALADKINLLRKEKEESQVNALIISQENERLVKEQNVRLEEEVAKRTQELENANEQVNHTLNNLKDAQTQLVDAEKMASLGQLTAGIAHEINNPINFVKSNINPLRLDIGDVFKILDRYSEVHSLKDFKLIQSSLIESKKMYSDLDIDFIKDEILNLIKGIEDGAERTAEIVRGLRTFTRIDESALKKVNIHDGLETTLVILKNNIPFDVDIIKDFHADGMLECFPGKINQVFMNIINNALQAMNTNEGSEKGNCLMLQTEDLPDGHIRITIKDTGAGMPPEVQKRIFEPFFTTKEVGEGTGLGLAIVYKIIQKHNGTIEVNSEVGVGTQFIITLPHDQVENIRL